MPESQAVPPRPIAKHSFGEFSWTVVVALVVVIFCIMFFYVRRKKSDKQIDEKAGDEGED